MEESIKQGVVYTQAGVFVSKCHYTKTCTRDGEPVTNFQSRGVEMIPGLKSTTGIIICPKGTELPLMGILKTGAKGHKFIKMRGDNVQFSGEECRFSNLLRQGSLVVKK